jgi:hypothetical protein
MKLNLKIVAATAAVAMMSSAAAYAGAISVANPTHYYSKEGLELTGTAGVPLPDITVTFGNNLTYQDDIILTLPGTTSVALTPSPTLVQCAAGPNNTGGAPAVGYVTTVAGGWAFRVTAVNGVSINDTCTFTGLKVQANTLASATGVINYQALRFQTGQLVDSATNPTGTGTAAIKVVSQFGVTPVVKLNGEIDVYDDRLSFSKDEDKLPGSAVAPASLNDTMNFDTTTGGGYVTFSVYSPVVSTSSQVATITGDFAWVDAKPNGDADGVCEQTDFQASLIGYAGWAVDKTLSNCTQVVLTGPTSGGSFQGFFKVPGTVILNPTDWQASITWKYALGSASSSLTTAWDPGIWTINGAQVYIQYMPYGTGITRIIYAANRGAITADATADIYYGGKVYSCTIGTIASRTVNELSGKVDGCVAANGITSGKVAIMLTFTAPDKDIEVYSAYNVGGNDRGTVVNTSNGRTFFYGTGVNFADAFN